MDHSEHRKRILARYDRGEYLEDHELLEILLFFSRPRVNTNGIAHDLIDTCGSLGDVFHSTEDRLVSVDGVGTHSARLIRIISDIMFRCNLSACDTTRIFSDVSERERFLYALFDGEENEKVYMIMFSKTKRYIGFDLIGEGLLSKGEICVTNATEKALKSGATHVIIAHNHPGGLALASKTDSESAERMNIIFGDAGITVAAHYVVAGHKCKTYGK